VRIDSLSIGSILSNTILYRWRIDWPVIVAKPGMDGEESKVDIESIYEINLNLDGAVEMIIAEVKP
jgi:hypothetical protein